MERKFKIWFADSQKKHHHREYLVNCRTEGDYKAEVEAQQKRIKAEGGVVIMTEINYF